jgi:hypothetical protein
MAILGIIVYREAEPIQPQPQVIRERKHEGEMGREGMESSDEATA